MKFKKTICSLVAAATIGLSGCGEKQTPQNYVEGTVAKEYGNVARVVESSGAIFGNESVKLGNPHYGLFVDTPQGKYTIEVDVDDRVGSSGPKTAYNLAAAIEEGTRIRFPTEFTGSRQRNSNGDQAGFNQRVGILDPDDIEILYNE